jgi:predicted ATP-dependent endonuclease of OLD family
VNCLIGPGDSGKSTVLDAVDFCLGARRNLAIADTDFYALDATQSVSISVTLGDLPHIPHIEFVNRTEFPPNGGRLFQVLPA